MVNDENYFRELAARKKLSYNFVIKEHKLMEILPKLYNLRENIVLKGGTALNQIYFEDFQRFSEDLDFDVFEDVTVESLKKSLKEIGIEPAKTFYKPGTIGFEISYAVGETKDLVKIEFNIEKKQFLKNKAVARNANSNIANFSVANIKTYALETLIVQKLVALINREEGKDYYDLFYALKLVDNASLEKELKLWKENKATDNDLIKNAIRTIDAIDLKILQRTNPFIPADKRIDWKIIKEDIKRALNALSGK